MTKRAALPTAEAYRVKRVNANDQAASNLLKMICSGAFRSGDRLPSQRELVTKMGVSLTTVREALRSLATTGVINIQPGRGVFVRSVPPEAIIHPELLSFLLEHETLLHAIEVRQVLEVEGIAMAAERAAPEDLKELERILKQMQRAIASGRRPLSYAPRFHFAIAKATHNPLYASLVKSFVRLLHREAEIIGVHVPGVEANEYQLHVELYEAILKRDPEEARRRMRRHLEEARRLIAQSFLKVNEGGHDLDGRTVADGDEAVGGLGDNP